MKLTVRAYQRRLTLKSIMALISRREFIQQTAFAAASLYRCPVEAIAKAKRMLETGQGNAASFDAAAVRKLASEIAGHVITPDASEYESARLVENRAFDRRPAIIVRCANSSDVARALDFCQRPNLPVAVRGGGHSAAGYGVCDGGVVIDLSGMKRVEVDARKRVVLAEAGCRGGDLDKATQRFGLATTLGACPTVGIAGLTLGGGEGRLMPKYGATCDNLASARLVTVDGRQIEASQNSNADLFWAIRGGGGNFGVATAFEYRLHPLGDVLTGALVYPAGQIPELLHAYVKFAGASPDEMNVVGMVSASERGPTFMMLVDYCGKPSLGNDLLRPLRGSLKPQEDSVKVMSYLEAQSTAFSGPPHAFFATDVFLPELSESAIAAVVSATQDAPRRFSVQIVSFHGAVTRVHSNEMAFPLREPGHDVTVLSYWNTSEERASAVNWAKALRDKLKPFARGAYANGLGEAGEELVKAAYGPNHARLVEIKKRYDPTNMLRLNQNIKPD